ncbi:MAG TPA: hypothetical protein VH063_03050 [Gaiellaceae bacterium]|jgi:photosystem II stability/assembly factor-like uncharacterized protein|nr:hypothetical protein [Gaiellaceae bacterium]
MHALPNAIAFRDPRHGVMGSGWQTRCAAANSFRCRAGGTISLTSNAGRTWRVVLRTPRPVVSVSLVLGTERAVLDDGENLSSADGGRTWVPAAPVSDPEDGPPCMDSWFVAVAKTSGWTWAICTGEPGVGNVDKSVYRDVFGRWQRVAWTPMVGQGRGHGGISTYGYPAGIAMAADGFGLIWESRGTLYVTRDGGFRWTALPRIAVPELDFGDSVAAIPGGIAFVLLTRSQARRLIVTHDAGRTWVLVHRWG